MITSDCTGAIGIVIMLTANMTTTSAVCAEWQSLGKVHFSSRNHSLDTIEVLVLDQINTRRTDYNFHSDRS